MICRRLSLVALAVATASVARADEAAPGMSVAPLQTSLSVYRQYVKSQAGTLVGMTKVLLEEIKAGNVDAAQSGYAPAHRYFVRIKPIADMVGDLGRRMDARADDFEGKEANPKFSGFHRLEYGLFARRSTAGLLEDAERLNKDARELKTRVALMELKPGALADAAAKLARDVADKKLGGDEERYSKTDFWDLEANIEGVQQIVAVLQPQAQPQNAKILAHTAVHFAKIAELLEKQKDGCGFKSFDEVSKEDKAALRAPVVALADELATLRGTLAKTDAGLTRAVD